MPDAAAGVVVVVRVEVFPADPVAVVAPADLDPLLLSPAVVVMPSPVTVKACVDCTVEVTTVIEVTSCTIVLDSVVLPVRDTM